ncbi:MAG TPA: hypothetical protein PLL64_06545 [Rhodothermales bacterium]|nr:hypothetical protein [Bacteroidota bacterium]HRK73914.1 hypothetical protein [Rhodothermales bacterium]HRR07321.1 hypothetical protein [Rhodothermales bacterium]
MKYFRFFSAFLFAFLLASCDEAPGPVSLSGRPPVLSNFQYSPQAANLAGLPVSQIEGENVRIPLALQITVTDADNTGIEAVSYGIYAPGQSVTPLLKGSLTGNAGQYAATANLLIAKGAVGEYTIRIQAIDRDGLVSNMAFGSFTYAAVGSPPVLASVEMPATIKRPVAGQAANKVVIVATASDPDGLSNIERVVLRTQSGAELLLLDDGQKTGLSGDETAGDGKFTLIIQVGSNNALGVNIFDFQAFDRTGLTSNVVRKSIEVVN